MNKRILEMCICITEQKLSEWYPSITLGEYIWLNELIKKEDV